MNPNSSSCQFGTIGKFIQQGWECPKCGAVMSPWQNHCINCTGVVNQTVTVHTNYTGINQSFIPAEGGDTNGKPKVTGSDTKS